MKTDSFIMCPDLSAEQRGNKVSTTKIVEQGAFKIFLTIQAAQNEFAWVTFIMS